MYKSYGDTCQHYLPHPSSVSPILIRQKVSEMKEEAKWHIQSRQALFEDRVRLLREKAVKTDDSAIKAQRQMGSEVSMLCVTRALFVPIEHCGSCLF